MKASRFFYIVLGAAVVGMAIGPYPGFGAFCWVLAGLAAAFALSFDYNDY